MSNYNKITALYSRLSVGDEDRDGGESNSIQNQKIFLENYAKGQQLTNIRHYIDDDESGRFFDRSAYSRMIEDVPKDSDFKVLYGMEAYLVDDLKGMVTNPKKQSLDGRFVVFDIETTGFSPLTCKIIEIGAVLVENGKITDRFSTFVNPQVPIPFRIEQLTSINDSMVIDARPIEEILGNE